VTEPELASLTPDQENIQAEVWNLVESAILDHCAGCSTAEFAPTRLGRAAATEKLPQGGAEDFAARLRACPGLGKLGTASMCRLPRKT
jgi:hypothetical protein